MAHTQSTLQIYSNLSALLFIGIGLILTLESSHHIAGYNLFNLSPDKIGTGFNNRPVNAKFASLNAEKYTAFNFVILPYSTPEGGLVLKFKNISIGNMQLKVIDLVGKELYTQNISVLNSGDYDTTVNLTGKIPFGVYFVKVECSNSVCTKMFIFRKTA